jgi:hypothetical protein
VPSVRRAARGAARRPPDSRRVGRPRVGLCIHGLFAAPIRAARGGSRAARWGSYVAAAGCRSSRSGSSSRVISMGGRGPRAARLGNAEHQLGIRTFGIRPKAELVLGIPKGCRARFGVPFWAMRHRWREAEVLRCPAGRLSRWPAQTALRSPPRAGADHHAFRPMTGEASLRASDDESRRQIDPRGTRIGPSRPPALVRDQLSHPRCYRLAVVLRRHRCRSVPWPVGVPNRQRVAEPTDWIAGRSGKVRRPIGPGGVCAEWPV